MKGPYPGSRAFIAAVSASARGVACRAAVEYGFVLPRVDARMAAETADRVHARTTAGAATANDPAAAAAKVRP
jgi:hypothetical protein